MTKSLGKPQAELEGTDKELDQKVGLTRDHDFHTKQGQAANHCEKRAIFGTLLILQTSGHIQRPRKAFDSKAL